VPTAAASRTIVASPQAVWDVVGDPHHLPRWWPRVTRVEGVEDGAFTEVLAGRKGKVVRADFKLVQASPPQRVVWSQRLQGTPFEGVLASAVTQIDLAPRQDGADRLTDVRIELRQELPKPLRARSGGGMLSGVLRGVPLFGGPIVQRAAARTLEQALDGLTQVFGDGR